MNDQRTLAYDGARRLQTAAGQTGDYVTYIWDQANRLTARQYRDHTKLPTDPPNDTDAFTFDAAGHMLTAASGRYNNTLTFAYDQAARLASESLTVGGQTYTVGRSYDAASRLAGLTYPDSSSVGRAYTNRNQLQQVTYNSATVASFTYDSGGRRSTRTLGDTPGTVTTCAYVTGGDLLASITTPNLPGFAYSYDTNKNKTAETITSVLQPYGFSTGASGYDNSDRLTAWNRTDGNKNQSWTLTAAGDWQQFIDAGTTHNRTHNSVHELTASDGTARVYDLKGNLTSNAVTGATYVWDFDNQLQQATVGGSTTSFTYDALGRRVSKTAGGATTVYVSAASGDGGRAMGQEIAEYASGAAPASPSVKYVFGTYIDEPLVMDAAGTLYYYHSNGQFSVQFLTSAAGAIVECYSYAGYGNPLIFAPDGVTQRSTSAVGNRLMYTGRRLDPETGLFYYRARYYDTSLGRFISRDPIGERRSFYFHSNETSWGNPADDSDDLVGRFAYVLNRPTALLDPSGLRATPPSGPIDDEFCGWLYWLIGNCCTVGQTAKFKRDCKAKGEVLVSAMCRPFGENCNLYSCKKKALYKCFCFTCPPFDPKTNSNWYKYGNCSDPPSDSACGNKCKAKGYAGGKCFPP